MTMAEAVLFVPGVGCDERLFAHQLAHLGEVAAPRFAGVPDASTVADMATALLDAAPERFAIVGLSLGGVVALEVVRRAPDRVTRLALCATSPQPDPPQLQEMRRAAADRVREGGLEDHVAAGMPMLLGSDAAGAESLVRDMANGVGAARYARQLEAVSARGDLGPSLAALSCPTLVVCGRNDIVIPPERHASLASAIPGARLAVVEDAAHLVPLCQPQAVTVLLRDWLAYDR